MIGARRHADGRPVRSRVGRGATRSPNAGAASRKRGKPEPTPTGAPSAVRPRAYARGVEQSEVVKRVVGILTEAGEIRRLLEEDADRDDLETDPGVVTVLLNETMPRIPIPEDASMEEIATLIGSEVGGAVEQLVGAFTLAFAMLAQVHDSGRTDLTSADVLRDLALRAEQIGSEGPEDTDS